MKLKELRKENKKNQEQIAKALNLTRVTYLRYEQGITEPTIETLCKLADYYNVSLDYLVGRNFANEYGYLNDTEKKLLENFRKLTPDVQLRFFARIEGAVIAQN